MKEVKFTRQELYDLVWTESMLTLAKKYDISDVGLRKKCNKLEIPIPNAGYWAKGLSSINNSKMIIFAT